MASLGGATEWLDTESLGPAELRGHVVLVNFWTWTCINWLRQEAVRPRVVQAYRTTGWLSSASTPWPTPCRMAPSGMTTRLLVGSWAHPPSSCSTVLSPWCCFRGSKLRRLAEGTPRTLTSMGVVDHEGLRKERLTEDQLMAVSAPNRSGIGAPLGTLSKSRSSICHSLVRPRNAGAPDRHSALEPTTRDAARASPWCDGRRSHPRVTA